MPLTVESESDVEALVRDAAAHARAIEDPAGWAGFVASGVLGATMPKAFGGTDASFTSLVATLEGLAYGGGDSGVLFAIAAQMLSVQHPILKFGTSEQQARFLPPLIAGRWRAAHAASEPEAGSDVFHLRTLAVRDRDSYRVRGTKRYITSAPIADLALVLAATDSSKGAWGISAFIVDLTLPGIQRTGNIDKLGLRGAQFGELAFDDCRVPVECRLGSEGAGLAIFSAALDAERAFILAPALGQMRRDLESAVAHANGRTQHGRTIGTFQSVSHRIADMAVRLEVSRLLVYRAARLRDAGKSIRAYGPLVKLAVSEQFLASSIDAARNAGAAAYLAADPRAVSMCDAFGSLFYSGTSDVLRNLVATHTGVNIG